jgi:hypothetical protein
VIRATSTAVMPAQAGIQYSPHSHDSWIAAFAAMNGRDC